MCWVVKVVLEWLEEVIDLFLRSRIAGDDDASNGNTFDQSTG